MNKYDLINALSSAEEDEVFIDIDGTLYEIDNIIDILEYHREKCDNVKVLIDDSIHYGDLRRGYTQEEYTRIKRAQRISSAIRNFIDTLKDVRDEQDN